MKLCLAVKSASFLYKWEIQMFIIMLNYIKRLDIVEKYLDQHKKFLEFCYKSNFFIASGPKNPRTGGVIISQISDRAQLDNLLKQDPFHINNIADYEIIEFTPSKYHPNFAAFIEEI